MGEVLPMPTVGDVFTDVRDDDRTMRVSYHADRGVVVVSLWLGPVCRGSFRMADGDVHRLISMLSEIDVSAAPSTPGPESSGGPRPQGASAGSKPLEQTDEISGPTQSGALSYLPVIQVA
jgi:hypothetical protein